MQADSIEFRGSYRYPDPTTLERALADALAQLAEDDHAELEVDWFRSFVRHGATLRISASLAGEGDRYLAAAVFETLAREAVEGVVEARRAGVALDFFPYGHDLD